MSFRSFILSIASNKWVEKFVKNSGLTRGIVRRFIAGESSASAVATADLLVSRGYVVSLDCLGEHVSTEAEADAAELEYLELIERIANSPNCGGRAPEKINISIKLSQLGLLLDEQRCLFRLNRILEGAEKSDNFVRIDMEDSSTVDATVLIVKKARSKHKNVGVVLQAMLLRTPKEIDWIIKGQIRTRLVKGAYMEPASVAHQAKTEVDDAYIKLGQRLIVEGTYTAFGTHDPRLCAALCAYAKQNGVGAGRFEFQMLYGINKRLQESLHKQGYTVRVYVPYGKSWYPYFSRRIAERPANLFFFLRSLFSR